MKILELHLEAFGPFTGGRLLLGGGGTGEGLQVVFGPNEAGKSSALRALEALLFGIPNRTGDNFLHPYGKLRLGGRLALDDGTEIAFRRRKGAKNTLLSADGGTVLEDSALSPFLREIGREIFRSVFGIDHETLVSGGRDLLEQRGEIGRALFAAGVGTRSLRRVLDHLAAEADALFLPRGANPAVNRILKEYGRTEEEIREASLSEQAWSEHRQALETLVAQVEICDGERRDHLRRLQSLRQILSSRRRQAAAGESRRRAAARLAQLEKRLTMVRPHDGIVENAEPIEGLHQRLGSHRRDLEELLRREGRHQQLLVQAREIVARLRPGSDLATAGELVSGPLEQAVARARREGDLDGRLASLASERETLVTLPSEEDLATARSRREELWERLKGAWRSEKGAKTAPGLETEYEEAVRAADILADRLRSEAARVSRKATIEAEVQELETFRLRHRAAITEVLAGLPGVALTPGECLDPVIAAAETALEDLAALESKLLEVEDGNREMEILRRATKGYGVEARRVIEEVGPGEAGEDVAALPVPELVTRLHRRLVSARQAETERKTLQGEIEQRKTEISEADADLESIGNRLETELLEVGAGASLEDLEREAAAVDPDALPGRIVELEEELAEVEARRDDLHIAKGREESELRRMDGGNAAAAAAERKQEIAARLRRKVEDFLRVRLAAMLVQREIERYRAENQAPVLARGGEIFARLTLGSFAGLATEFGEGDEAILLGVRPGGEALTVDAMSSGTRDQLYLALRIATLERHLESGEPMPFIVDDILINFDDQRSAAALEVLADLGKKTQVLLFTHHKRIVEQAERLPGSAATVHRLDGGDERVSKKPAGEPIEVGQGDLF